MDGRGHINTGDAVLATKGLPERWSGLIVKVSGRMCSTTLKKTSLQLYSNNFGLKQPSTTINIFHYYGTVI